MEDVELALRLRGKLHGMPIVIKTSSSKYSEQGWFRRGRKNILILIRFLLGADPNKLYTDYY
jgi:hypothetical protein